MVDFIIKYPFTQRIERFIIVQYGYAISHIIGDKYGLYKNGIIKYV